MAYRTLVKNVTGFTPLQLVHGVEFGLPIECENPSLKLAIKCFPYTNFEEERLFYLEKLYEHRRDTTMVNEEHKKCIKARYDQNACPIIFSEGYLVLVYDQDKDTLGEGKFVSMWLYPYIIKHVLGKGSFDLIDYYENTLKRPRNRL